MSSSIVRDAFAHHVWATTRLIDACRAVSEEQLQADVSGTFGSILNTMRHLVGADASYLAVTSGESLPPLDEDEANLGDLRAAMEAHGPLWAALVSQDLDPDQVVVRSRDDGSESHAPLGIRLAQVLHHGSDHRSQICTALTLLGIEPPEIDVWDYGRDGGTVFEVLPE